ncbi:MAG: DNA replication/repair protein RecF [Gammaproteobacteria bacterium]
MQIEWLQIRQVRNLLDVELQALHPGINVFYGPNGSGKTAILEAIHCLSRCRSFRTARIDRVVNHQFPILQVSAGLNHADFGKVTTGVERGNGHINIRFNNASVNRVSVQAAQIPILTITPDSHELITGSPGHRRKWLDWAMFHMEHNYVEQWRSYHKALKQRNHLLKAGQQQGLGAWESRLEEAAIAINQARQAYLGELLQQLRRVCEQLGVICPQVDYEQGWPAGRELGACLQENRGMDAKLGRTRWGIHRSELAIKADEGLVAHSYSRGQIRLLINALSWAQAQVIHHRTGSPPVLLADDLLAELDQAAKQQILGIYQAYTGQVFITTTHDPLVMNLPEGKLFHVEHGQVNLC